MTSNIATSGRVWTPTDAFERRYGRFGDRERRELPLVVDELHDSGDPKHARDLVIRGHAAVFDSWSLDLGGFREKIDRAAFDRVLDEQPDVWLLWDHDSRWTLARTANKTLELRIDPMGLHYWARAAPTSYAADLRVLMERGDINQASFAFTVERDEWRVLENDNGEEQVERTILEVGGLYDVTVTATGAYPQTDSQVVRQRAVDYARQHGRIPTDGPPGVAPPEGSGAEASHLAQVGAVDVRFEAAKRKLRQRAKNTTPHI